MIHCSKRGVIAIWICKHNRQDQALVIESFEEGASLIESKAGLDSGECVQRMIGDTGENSFRMLKVTCTLVYTQTQQSRL